MVFSAQGNAASRKAFKCRTPSSAWAPWVLVASAMLVAAAVVYGLRLRERGAMDYLERHGGFHWIIRYDRMGRVVSLEHTDSGPYDDLMALQIAKLRSLRQLRLADCDLTDWSLQQLSGLPNLELLDIRGTRVTQTGVREFRAKNPRCRVEY